MQIIYKKKKYLLLSLFFIASLSIDAASFTNFLPIEDEMSVMRNNHVVYGASIDAIKPYRQPLAVLNGDEISHSKFNSTDIFICLLLLCVYFIFTHKRSQTRNIDI